MPDIIYYCKKTCSTIVICYCVTLVVNETNVQIYYNSNVIVAFIQLMYTLNLQYSINILAAPCQEYYVM